MVSIEFIELSDERARFVLEGVNPWFANALRRTLMTDIPKMAIEDVEFHLGPIRVPSGKEYESISPLFDEIVAHRLGLVPIPTDLTQFKFREDCTCGGEGCPSCTIMYTLNKKGPCTVYSGDLEPLGGPQFAIKDQLIPIMKLADGQAPLIYAHAILGTGREHAKWEACNGVGYKYAPQVTINQRKVPDPEEIKRVCPRDCFEVEDKKLKLVRESACNLCGACMEKAPGGCVVKGDENKFIFKFETDGSVTALQALQFAMGHLEKQFAEFRDKVAELAE